MTNIKPCPFCGGKAIYGGEVVFCTVCGASTKRVYPNGDNRWDYQDLKREAITSWNRRVENELQQH